MILNCCGLKPLRRWACEPGLEGEQDSAVGIGSERGKERKKRWAKEKGEVEE